MSGGRRNMAVRSWWGVGGGGLLALVLCGVQAQAAPIVFTDRASWEAAVLGANAGAEFRIEDFNAEPLTPGTPGALGYGLGVGPHSYGGGDISMTLSNPGSGGSQVGIINPGAHDGSNALEIRVVEDSSDIMIGPLLIQGEGVEGMDFSFLSGVIAIGFDVQSGRTHDQVSIGLNGGAGIDILPDMGFFGILDIAGISSFQLVVALQDPDNSFEQFEMDDLEYVVPEPSALWLLGAALLPVGLGRGRRLPR